MLINLIGKIMLGIFLWYLIQTYDGFWYDYRNIDIDNLVLIIVYHTFRPHFNLMLFQEQEEVDFNFPQMVRLYLNYILDFFNHRLAHTRAVLKLRTVRKTSFNCAKTFLKIFLRNKFVILGQQPWNIPNFNQGTT